MGSFGNTLASGIASGLGGTIGGAAGSIASGLFSIGAQKRQYRYQKKLMDQQYKNQLDFWNKQNEYNSPAAQMQRLVSANLNPHMMYGNGDAGMTAASGALSSSPAAGAGFAPDFRGASVNPTALAQNKLLQEQVNVAKSQASKNAMEALYYGSMTGNFNRKNTLFDRTVDDVVQGIKLQNDSARSNIDLNTAKINELNESINTMRSQQNLNSEQANLMKAEAQQIQTLTPWRVKEIWSNIQKNDSDIRRNSVLNGLTEYQVMDITQSWSKIAYDIQEGMSRKDLNEVMARYLPKEFVRRCVSSGADVLSSVTKLIGVIYTRGASVMVPPLNPNYPFTVQPDYSSFGF